MNLIFRCFIFMMSPSQMFSSIVFILAAVQSVDPVDPASTDIGLSKITFVGNDCKDPKDSVFFSTGMGYLHESLQSKDMSLLLKQYRILTGKTMTLEHLYEFSENGQVKVIEEDDEKSLLGENVVTLKVSNCNYFREFIDGFINQFYYRTSSIVPSLWMKETFNISTPAEYNFWLNQTLYHDTSQLPFNSRVLLNRLISQNMWFSISVCAYADNDIVCNAKYSELVVGRADVVVLMDNMRQIHGIRLRNEEYLSYIQTILKSLQVLTLPRLDKGTIYRNDIYFAAATAYFKLHSGFFTHEGNNLLQNLADECALSKYEVIDTFAFLFPKLANQKCIVDAISDLFREILFRSKTVRHKITLQDLLDTNVNLLNITTFFNSTTMLFDAKSRQKTIWFTLALSGVKKDLVKFYSEAIDIHDCSITSFDEVILSELFGLHVHIIRNNPAGLRPFWRQRKSIVVDMSDAIIKVFYKKADYSDLIVTDLMNKGFRVDDDFDLLQNLKLTTSVSTMQTSDSIFGTLKTRQHFWSLGVSPSIHSLDFVGSDLFDVHHPLSPVMLIVCADLEYYGSITSLDYLVDQFLTAAENNSTRVIIIYEKVNNFILRVRRFRARESRYTFHITDKSANYSTLTNYSNSVLRRWIVKLPNALVEVDDIFGYEFLEPKDLTLLINFNRIYHKQRPFLDYAIDNFPVVDVDRLLSSNLTVLRDHVEFNSTKHCTGILVFLSNNLEDFISCRSKLSAVCEKWLPRIIENESKYYLVNNPSNETSAVEISSIHDILFFTATRSKRETPPPQTFSMSDSRYKRNFREFRMKHFKALVSLSKQPDFQQKWANDIRKPLYKIQMYVGTPVSLGLYMRSIIHTIVAGSLKEILWLVGFAVTDVFRMVITPILLNNGLILTVKLGKLAVLSILTVIPVILQIIHFAFTIKDFVDGKIGTDAMVIASFGLALSIVYSALILASFWFTVGTAAILIGLAVPVMGFVFVLFALFANGYSINRTLDDAHQRLPMGFWERVGQGMNVFFAGGFTHHYEHNLKSKLLAEGDTNASIHFLNSLHGQRFDAIARPRIQYHKIYVKYPLGPISGGLASHTVTLDFSRHLPQPKYRDAPEVPAGFKLLCMGASKNMVEKTGSYISYKCDGGITIGRGAGTTNLTSLLVWLPSQTQNATVITGDDTYTVVQLASKSNNISFGKRGGQVHILQNTFSSGVVESRGPVDLVLEDEFMVGWVVKVNVETKDMTVFYPHWELRQNRHNNGTHQFTSYSDVLSTREKKLSISKNSNFASFTGRKNSVEDITIGCDMTRVVPGGGISESLFDVVNIPAGLCCNGSIAITINAFSLTQNLASCGLFEYRIPVENKNSSASIFLPDSMNTTNEIFTSYNISDIYFVSSRSFCTTIVFSNGESKFKLLINSNTSYTIETFDKWFITFRETVVAAKKEETNKNTELRISDLLDFAKKTNMTILYEDKKENIHFLSMNNRTYLTISPGQKFIVHNTERKFVIHFGNKGNWSVPKSATRIYLSDMIGCLVRLDISNINSQLGNVTINRDVGYDFTNQSAWGTKFSWNNATLIMVFGDVFHNMIVQQDPRIGDEILTTNLTLVPKIPIFSGKEIWDIITADLLLTDTLIYETVIGQFNSSMEDGDLYIFGESEVYICLKGVMSSSKLSSLTLVFEDKEIKIQHVLEKFVANNSSK